MVLLVDSGGSKAGKTLSVCGLVSRRPGPWPPAVRPPEPARLPPSTCSGKYVLTPQLPGTDYFWLQ